MRTTENVTNFLNIVESLSESLLQHDVFQRCAISYTVSSTDARDETYTKDCIHLLVKELNAARHREMLLHRDSETHHDTFYMMDVHESKEKSVVHFLNLGDFWNEKTPPSLLLSWVW